MGWKEDGQLVEDIMQLHAHFAELVSVRDGTFQFRRAPAEQVSGPFEVPLRHILASGLAHQEEMSQSELPGPLTVFERIEHRDAWLGEELQVFWERAETRLRHGASAASLVEVTGASVGKAQQYLQRLRLVGMVRVRRLAPGTPARPRPPEARASWEATPHPEGDSISRADLTGIRPVVPSKPLVRRLMDGLARWFR
ncbi:MAG: hypothetical protein JSR82_04740 [Verrucomicrobia bacterium]|nr:hypothetical protein [Verrucomicrobiota bacterium]